MITQIDIDDYSAMSPRATKIMGGLSLAAGIVVLIGSFILSEYYKFDARIAVFVGLLLIAQSTTMKHKEMAIQMAIKLKTDKSVDNKFG